MPELEDDRGGVWIDMDVEFGRGRHIADLETGAAHDDELADPGGDVGGLDQCHGDVGQRPEGGQGDAARLSRAQGFDDEIDTVLRLQGHRRLGQTQLLTQ